MKIRIGGVAEAIIFIFFLKKEVMYTAKAENWFFLVFLHVDIDLIVRGKTSGPSDGLPIAILVLAEDVLSLYPLIF